MNQDRDQKLVVVDAELNNFFPKNQEILNKMDQMLAVQTVP
jgi:hypothetical protein